MTTDTPAARLQKFVERWRLNPQNDHDRVYTLAFQEGGETVSITLDTRDLLAVTEALDKIKAYVTKEDFGRGEYYMGVDSAKERVLELIEDLETIGATYDH